MLPRENVRLDHRALFHHVVGAENEKLPRDHTFVCPTGTEYKTRKSNSLSNDSAILVVSIRGTTIGLNSGIAGGGYTS